MGGVATRPRRPTGLGDSPIPLALGYGRPALRVHLADVEVPPSSSSHAARAAEGRAVLSGRRRGEGAEWRRSARFDLEPFGRRTGPLLDPSETVSPDSADRWTWLGIAPSPSRVAHRRITPKLLAAHQELRHEAVVGHARGLKITLQYWQERGRPGKTRMLLQRKHHMVTTARGQGCSGDWYSMPRRCPAPRSDWWTRRWTRA